MRGGPEMPVPALDARAAGRHHARVRSLVLIVFALTAPLAPLACERDKTEPTPAATLSSAAPAKDASMLLRGTWQVDGFEAAAASGSASAAALQAQAANAEALAVRITYTDRQVKVNVPGQPTLASLYTVLETHPAWCRLKNGRDEVVITFQDDDHMTIDRKGNDYGSKMKMRRVTGAAPTDVPPPPPSFTVVGTTDAGHMIVKMNPTP